MPQSYEKHEKIIVTVEGGVVQGVLYPVRYRGPQVVIHDYDTDGEPDEQLRTDADGAKFRLIDDFLTHPQYVERESARKAGRHA